MPNTTIHRTAFVVRQRTHKARCFHVAHDRQRTIHNLLWHALRHAQTRRTPACNFPCAAPYVYRVNDAYTGGFRDRVGRHNMTHKWGRAGFLKTGCNRADYWGLTTRRQPHRLRSSPSPAVGVWYLESSFVGSPARRSKAYADGGRWRVFAVEARSAMELQHVRAYHHRLVIT
jgi:hypothetical protein